MGQRRYEPMMSAERAERLRLWQERVYLGSRRTQTLTSEQLGLTVVVPPDVYPPNPNGLAEVVLKEVRTDDRVLDMGTGSGINALAAATKSSQVVAVDINPSSVLCARDNAARNGVSDRISVLESDLFAHVRGPFDLIMFDPPFRWFPPRDMVERATTDENYATLTAFFDQARRFLSARGRILLTFGTTGDLDYLHLLIQQNHLTAEELRRREFVKDDLPVAYLTYRVQPVR